MRGLLGGGFFDPVTQGLLAAGGSMLQASGPSRMPTSLGSIAGQGLLTGMGAANSAQQAQLGNQMQALQMEGMRGSLDEAKRTRDAIEAFAAQLPPDQQGIFRANPAAFIKSATEGYNLSADQIRMQGGKEQARGIQSVSYQDTGSHLIPVTKDGKQAGPSIPKSVTPDKQAGLEFDKFQFENQSLDQRLRLGQQQHEHGTLSMAQRVAAGQRGQELGLQGVNTYFNTGMTLPGGVGGLPQVGQPRTATPPFNAAPSPTPASLPSQAPAAAPAPMSIHGNGLPPKMQAQAKKADQEQRDKREFNMTGLNEAIDRAEIILKGGARQDLGGKKGNRPTASGIGQGVDWVSSLFGASPAGAAEADQLRAVAGILVSKMPRMEGPQSDKDVDLYKQAAGDVGNAGLPIERRLASLQVVRELHGKYDKSKPAVRVVDF